MKKENNNLKDIDHTLFEVGALYKLVSYDDDIVLAYPIDKDILIYTGITYNRNHEPCYGFYLLKHKKNTHIFAGYLDRDPAKSYFNFEKI